MLTTVDNLDSLTPSQLREQIDLLHQELKAKEAACQKAELELRDRVGQLQDLQIWLRSILESCKEPIVVHDLDGRYLYTNSSRNWGGRNNGVTGRSVSDFHSPEQAEGILNEIRRVASTGHPTIRFWEFAENGREYCFIVHRYPLKNLKQEIYAVASIAINVTDICRPDSNHSGSAGRRRLLNPEWNHLIAEIRQCLIQPERLRQMNSDELASLQQFLIRLQQPIQSRPARTRRSSTSRTPD